MYRNQLIIDIMAVTFSFIVDKLCPNLLLEKPQISEKKKTQLM